MVSLSSKTLRRGWTFLSTAARVGTDVMGSRVEEARLPDAFRPDPADRFVAAAYFGSDPHSDYQLEQWLWPFEQLRDSLVEAGEGPSPFGIIVRDPRVARRVAKRTDLPVRFSRLTKGLDEFFSSPSLRIVFYVNQATMNFQALRFPVPAHVHLSHGESEKISMISNQLKAYDFVFTAGQAARDRIGSILHGLDEEALIDVGRPQLDRTPTIPAVWHTFAATAPTGRVAFYAPTWEGDSSSMAYGSIPDTGAAVVEQLLSAGYRVIFRAHPRTGLFRGDFARALEAVQAVVDAHPRGFVDTTPDVTWQLQVADVAFAEMSSVAFDWLSTQKPLIMIPPTDSRAEVLPGGLLDRAVSWRGQQPDVDSVTALIAAAEDREAAELSRHYLGDTAPGAQIDRFVAAGQRVIDARRRELDHSTN
ncbi:MULTISPECIES: CDP-glycerol glycerophosphotransferase family protein [unclassified Brevibacterium]|uniref:CDP-glycerol glycerophosphotransferase family protein n=1 Tax=unclassified Brevibacterium TaxID=2614124 RepID=UPI0010F5E8C4|nr:MULTISPECIES: CDP-glycerol glycerophosphotransferase family protein [unclassified Brevibacterium]MCM1011566.1 CDP-glycerol glycerophosphotransferase family protein [Brevibacterium sp. XM4083]